MIRQTFLGIFFTVFGLSSVAVQAETMSLSSRNSWTNWQGKWDGDFWNDGSFGDSQFMTCVGIDGSDGSPEFWAQGHGNHAARHAYQQTLDWANVAERNPTYIEVHCGY